MNIREHIFFILFALCTIPFALVALPFLIVGLTILLMGVAVIAVWNYTMFPLLIWFEEWFVRKSYYINLRGKDGDNRS